MVIGGDSWPKNGGDEKTTQAAAASGRPTLQAILKEMKATPGGYASTARHIESGMFEGLSAVNVGILATFTLDLLHPYLVVEAAARGLFVKAHFAPYDQLEQQVLDPTSTLYQRDPNVVVIATRLEEIAPDFVSRFSRLSQTEIEEQLVRIEGRIQGLVTGLRKNSKAAVLIFNYAPPVFLAAGMADSSLEYSQCLAVSVANRRIAEVCRQISDTYVFDYARMTQELGLDRWFDPKLWYLWRIPVSAEAQRALGRRLARYLRAIRVPSCKCLVVDLDNTLWGGVLGEDGIEGIELGEDYPGNVYKDFQRRLLALRDQGVLLAIASKNNEADVLEAFERRQDFVLRLDDFSAYEINWGDKAESLSKIASRLNIGSDSLGFFDDNPVERDWIRSKLPEVTVFDVPDNPMDFVRTLEDSGAFDRLSLTVEDRERAEIYKQDNARSRLQATGVSLEEFLRQLEMTATIGYVGRKTIPRVSQLIAKTNQFNLTTRRHTARDLEALISSGAVALWLRVSDRFGDNGLVGLAIAVPNGSSSWMIDSFLMSCRVIGRRADAALLSALAQVVRDHGGPALFGQWVPTRKNGLVSGFFKSYGFESADREGHLWKWDFARGTIPEPTSIKVVFERETDN